LFTHTHEHHPLDGRRVCSAVLIKPFKLEMFNKLLKKYHIVAS